MGRAGQGGLCFVWWVAGSVASAGKSATAGRLPPRGPNLAPLLPCPTYSPPPLPPRPAGEIPWVKTVVDTHHEEAARKGLRIVPCCGFDSTPFDLGALLVVNHMRERLGKKPAKVLNVVMGSKGGVSGGTIARSVGSRPALPCPPARADELEGAAAP